MIPSAAYPDGTSFEKNWVINYDSLPENIFSEEAFTRVFQKNLFFEATAAMGVAGQWRKESKFQCYEYVGAEPYNPKSFNHMRKSSLQDLDLSKCVSEADVDPFLA